MEYSTICVAYTYGSFFFFTIPICYKAEGTWNFLKTGIFNPKKLFVNPTLLPKPVPKRMSLKSVSDLCLFFRFFLQPFSHLLLVFTIDFNLLFLPPRLILFSCLLPPNWNRKCVGFCPKEREKFFPCLSGFFFYFSFNTQCCMVHCYILTDKKLSRGGLVKEITVKVHAPPPPPSLPQIQP